MNMIDRVLVVDDEPMMRHMIGQILTHLGYESLCAASVDEAAALLDVHMGAVRALVVDYSLAEGSCGALVAHVRRTAPTLPVVLMSGHDPEFPGILAARADAFLAKPFEVEELVDAIERAVEGRRTSPGVAS